MTIIVLILSIAVTDAKNIAPHNRVIDGVDDIHGEFPYVVSFQQSESFSYKYDNLRMCTGTLIAPEWVLTAAHCHVDYVTVVRYGNMTVPRNQTNAMRKILQKIPHPNYKFLPGYMTCNDIGLVLIEPIHMAVAKLSAVDYKTLEGGKVRFAGFGNTFHSQKRDPNIDTRKIYAQKPLQLGEGVVKRCSDAFVSGPFICVVAKCTNKLHGTSFGDSGGPLFHDNKIVGVTGGGDRFGQMFYTPVSPSLTWLSKVMELRQIEISMRH